MNNIWCEHVSEIKSYRGKTTCQVRAWTTLLFTFICSPFYHRSLFVWLSAHFLFSPAAPPPLPSHPVIKHKLPSFVFASCHSVFSSPRCLPDRRPDCWTWSEPEVDSVDPAGLCWLSSADRGTFLLHWSKKHKTRRLHSHKIYMSTISHTKPSCREKTSDTSGTETSRLSQSARLSVHHLQNHAVFLLQLLFYCFNHTMFSVLISELEPFLHRQANKVWFWRGWSLYQAECLH